MRQVMHMKHTPVLDAAVDDTSPPMLNPHSQSQLFSRVCGQDNTRSQPGKRRSRGGASPGQAIFKRAHQLNFMNVPLWPPQTPHAEFEVSPSPPPSLSVSINRQQLFLVSRYIWKFQISLFSRVAIGWWG